MFDIQLKAMVFEGLKCSPVAKPEFVKRGKLNEIVARQNQNSFSHIYHYYYFFNIYAVQGRRFRSGPGIRLPGRATGSGPNDIKKRKTHVHLCVFFFF